MISLPTLLAPYLGQTLTPELVQQITDLTTLTTADVPEPITGDWVAAPVKDNSYTVKVELVGTRVLQTGNTMTIDSAVLTAIGFPR